MNQTEKRRKKLLEQTRSLYSDTRNIPPVHPRYKAMYHHLYVDEYEAKAGTFGVRMGICIILFIGYMIMDDRGVTVFENADMQVLEKIMQNIKQILY